MKTATLSEIRKDLAYRSPEELKEVCLRLARFKKENKELLTYLLFESEDEDSFIASVKRQVEDQFEQINRNSFFYIKKSIRKILREIKKYARYSPYKSTEVELHLYFCEQMKSFQPSIKRNVSMKLLYDRQIEYIKKKIATLHEDLQYDYTEELKQL